jgi:hypothetical protein
MLRFTATMIFGFACCYLAPYTQPCRAASIAGIDLTAGSVTASGPTYIAAYNAALAKVPAGSRVISAQASNQGGTWVVTIYFA